MKKTQGFARLTFDLEKQGWEDRNKMSADKAKEMFEAISGWDEETIKKMSAAFAEAQKSWSARTPFSKMAGTVMGETGFTKASVDLYAQYLQLQKEGEKDVMPKLFKIYTEFNTANISAQERYNSLLRYTTGLLKEQGEAVVSISRQKGFTAETGHLGLPSFGATPGLAGPPKTVLPIQTVESLTKGLLDTNDAIGLLSNSFEELFSKTGEGFQGMIDNILAGINRMLSEMAAKAVLWAILNIITGGEAGTFKAFMGFTGGASVGGGANVGNAVGSAPIGMSPGLPGGELQFKISGKDLITVMRRNGEA